MNIKFFKIIPRRSKLTRLRMTNSRRRFKLSGRRFNTDALSFLSKKAGYTGEPTTWLVPDFEPLLAIYPAPHEPNDALEPLDNEVPF